MFILFTILMILSVLAAIGCVAAAAIENSMLYFLVALACVFLGWVFWRAAEQSEIF